jgi:hypothetical protein
MMEFFYSVLIVLTITMGYLMLNSLMNDIIWPQRYKPRGWSTFIIYLSIFVILLIFVTVCTVTYLKQ